MVSKYHARDPQKAADRGLPERLQGAPAEAVRATSSLPFGAGFHQARASQESSLPFICPPKSALPQDQVRAWVNILESRLRDLVPLPLLQQFAEVLAEDPSLRFDPACFDSFIEDLGSQPPPKALEAHENGYFRQPAGHKRPLPSHTNPLKRRKSESQAKYAAQVATIDEPSANDELDPDSEDDESDEFDEFVGAGVVFETIRIDDTRKVWEAIDTRLRQMKQDACKRIAKAWVKAKEPQKQTRYPYNGGPHKAEAKLKYGEEHYREHAGEFTKPDWWCDIQGWERGEGCRHREPDHQRKPERLFFMKHMLRNEEISLLQESTKELRASFPPWIVDHLDTIYSLRRTQRRYERGEIGADTFVPIEVPNLPLSASSKGLLKESESRVKEHRKQMNLPSAAVSPHTNPSKQKVVVDRPSFKIESFEPRSISLNYPQRIPSDDDYNEMGFPNGQDMNCDLLGPAEDTNSSLPTIGQMKRRYPLTHIEESQNHLHAHAGDSNVYSESSPCLHTGELNRYFLDRLQFDGAATGDARFHSAPWTGVEDPLVSSINATPGRLPSHGLPFVPPSSSSNADYVFGSSTLSHPGESSIHETFPKPSGLRVGYECQHSWPDRMDLDDPTPATIDPRSVLLLGKD